jgi:hypothetical protein
VGEGDDDRFVGDQILDGDLALVRHQLGQRAWRTFLTAMQFVLDDGQHAGLAGEDVEQVADVRAAWRIRPRPCRFPGGELVEAQVEDGVDLPLGQA